MSEMLKYYTVEELRALSLDELRALWELVPTDRQRAYRAAYDREVKTAGAEGSDAKERRIALALLKRYHESHSSPLECAGHARRSVCRKRQSLETA